MQKELFLGSQTKMAKLFHFLMISNMLENKTFLAYLDCFLISIGIKNEMFSLMALSITIIIFFFNIDSHSLKTAKISKKFHINLLH